MRIDVIVNSTARRYRARPSAVEAVRRACERRAELSVTRSLDELTGACAAIASRGTDLVVLSGGDGTYMAGVTALARSFGEDRLPPIALIPGGTVATVARNWGMKGDPLTLLGEILAIKGAPPSTARPTLRVRGVTGSSTSEERIGFIFGTGLVANFFDVYYAEGAGGYAGAARIVARVFAGSFVGGRYARRVLNPLACTIEVEGRPLRPQAWTLICASVVRNLGIHMLVTYRAGEDHRRPHLVCSTLTSAQMGPRLPLVLAGRCLGGAEHFDDLVSEFVVRFGSEGPYVLDGDMLRAREIIVSAGPSIRVVDLDGGAR
jgi:diacylglycerol kinase (ATP)